MRNNKILAVVLALLTAAAAGCEKNEGKTSPETTDALACIHDKSRIENGTILHAWCWSFNTVADSIEDIAAAGYTAVQVSPANAVIEGGNGGMQLMGKGKWYYQYQPTDWTVGNYQLGTEDDFRAMCEKAEQYGISIIVDVVPNHTAADISAVSEDLINAAGGIDKLYHKNYTKRISNYSSRIECTSYSLSGLPDVNTENPDFQNYFIAYLNRLIADGADGFRYDTAKHIALPDDPQVDENLPNNFWERVTTEIDDAAGIFNYGEVLQGDNDRIEAYQTAIGYTTASDYGKQLRGLLIGEMLNAKMLTGFKVGDSEKCVTWVESHDNYTDGSSAALDDSKILRGWAVIAAQGGGTPLFFDRPYGADGYDRWGEMNRIGAAGSTLYKHPAVAAVNIFRTAMNGEPTEMANCSENAALLINRGAKGTVIVNSKANKDLDISAPTALPDGIYPDRSGMNEDFTVSGGTLTGKLKAGTIAVLYNEGYKYSNNFLSVWLETDSFVNDKTFEVTLHLTGTDPGSCELDAGTKITYSDGTKIKLYPDTKWVRLSAENEGGRTVMTYYFTERQTVPAGAQFGFEKPESWGDTIYAYIYNESGASLRKNAVWPGKEMSRGDDGTYTYTLEEEWDSALVIFSDGKSQYPAAMEPGLDLAEGMIYSVPW